MLHEALVAADVIAAEDTLRLAPSGSAVARWLRRRGWRPHFEGNEVARSMELRCIHGAASCRGFGSVCPENFHVTHHRLRLTRHLGYCKSPVWHKLREYCCYALAGARQRVFSLISSVTVLRAMRQQQDLIVVPSDYCQRRGCTHTILLRESADMVHVRCFGLYSSSTHANVHRGCGSPRWCLEWLASSSSSWRRSPGC